MQLYIYFYFPKTGIYKHFPTNISVNGEIAAKAPFTTIRVQKTQSTIDEEDIEDVLASGSVSNIIKFMSTKNILGGLGSVRFELKSVYYLCRNKEFYTKAISILKRKNIFDLTFWSFSVLHNDTETMKEYFNCKDISMKAKIGPLFQSSLVEVNDRDEAQDQFNFLDYYPLVNARAHRVGGMDSNSSNASQETKQWILNQNFRETYMKFIVQLVTKRHWSANDRLMLVTYLLMQERVSEALTQFEAIQESDFKDKFGDARLQYDYIKAYLDFYECGKQNTLEFKAARPISAKYKDYPVQHWRVLFKEIADQIEEIDLAYQPDVPSKVEINNFEDSEIERKKKLVSLEPSVEITVSSQLKSITIDYANVSRVVINFYPIDLEVLFSKSPFFQSIESQDNFSFVLPFHSQSVDLDTCKTSATIEISENLQNQNMAIEVVAPENNGLKVMKTYFSSTLRVHVMENAGELKVTKGDLPLPETYVKVYSMKSENIVAFFKDGYTDMRGRFDYGQLSGTSIADVQKFAIQSFIILRIKSMAIAIKLNIIRFFFNFILLFPQYQIYNIINDILFSKSIFAIFIQNDAHGSMIKEAKPPSGSKKD